MERGEKVPSDVTELPDSDVNPSRKTEPTLTGSELTYVPTQDEHPIKTFDNVIPPKDFQELPDKELPAPIQPNAKEQDDPSKVYSPSQVQEVAEKFPVPTHVQLELKQGNLDAHLAHPSEETKQPSGLHDSIIVSPPSLSLTARSSVLDNVHINVEISGSTPDNWDGKLRRVYFRAEYEKIMKEEDVKAYINKMESASKKIAGDENVNFEKYFWFNHETRAPPTLYDDVQRMFKDLLDRIQDIFGVRVTAIVCTYLQEKIDQSFKLSSKKEQNRFLDSIKWMSDSLTTTPDNPVWPVLMKNWLLCELLPQKMDAVARTKTFCSMCLTLSTDSNTAVAIHSHVYPQQLLKIVCPSTRQSKCIWDSPSQKKLGASDSSWLLECKACDGLTNNLEEKFAKKLKDGNDEIDGECAVLLYVFGVRSIQVSTNISYHVGSCCREHREQLVRFISQALKFRKDYSERKRLPDCWDESCKEARESVLFCAIPNVGTEFLNEFPVLCQFRLRNSNGSVSTIPIIYGQLVRPSDSTAWCYAIPLVNKEEVPALSPIFPKIAQTVNRWLNVQRREYIESLSSQIQKEMPSEKDLKLVVGHLREKCVIEEIVDV